MKNTQPRRVVVSYDHGQQFIWCAPCSDLQEKSEKLTLSCIQTKYIPQARRPQKHDKQVLRLLDSCRNYKKTFLKDQENRMHENKMGHLICAPSATLATSFQEYSSATEKLKTNKWHDQSHERAFYDKNLKILRTFKEEKIRGEWWRNITTKPKYCPAHACQFLC